MFAGRYLWWMLMGIGIFLFAALSLDYITWLTIQLSGCGEMAGAWTSKSGSGDSCRGNIATWPHRQLSCTHD